MIPIILVGEETKQITNFLQEYITTNRISKNYVFHIHPVKEEISIAQIRALKKEIVIGTTHLRLYILYSFDLSAAEVQNALLKSLEEQGEFNQFLLIVKNEYALLPTVRSRARIIHLEGRPPIDFKSKNEVASLINRLRISDKPNFLTDSLVIGITRDKALLLFDQLIYFFRNNLENEPVLSVQSLKKILFYKNLLVNNNINPQLSVDSLLIFIWKMNSMK